MAEKEQEHRISIEGTAIRAEASAIGRGQWLGSALGGICVVGAIGAIWLQAHWTAPLAFLSVPICGVVKAIVSSARAKREQ